MVGKRLTPKPRPLGVGKPRFAQAYRLVTVGAALIGAIQPLARLNRAQRRDWARSARRAGKGYTK